MAPMGKSGSVGCPFLSYSPCFESNEFWVNPVAQNKQDLHPYLWLNRLILGVFYLGEAESGLERLHQCAEKELQIYLDAESPSKDFNDFRTKLAGLTRYMLLLSMSSMLALMTWTELQNNGYVVSLWILLYFLFAMRTWPPLRL